MDVKQLGKTLTPLSGNSEVYIRVHGLDYPVLGCDFGRSPDNPLVRRLIFVPDIPVEAVDEGEAEEIEQEPVGAPPEVVKRGPGRPKKVDN